MFVVIDGVQDATFWRSVYDFGPKNLIKVNENGKNIC